MENQDTDQRSYRRFRVRVDCTLILSNGHRYQGRAENISFGGIYLSLDATPSAKDQHQQGDFQLTTKVFGRPVEVSGSCQTLHTEDRGFHLCFNEVDDQNTERLLSLISDLSD